MVARRFQKVHRPFDIYTLVQRWFLQAWPDPRARRQVDNLINLNSPEQFADCGTVRQIAVKELKRFAQGLEVRDVAPLELGVIEWIQVVKSPNLMVRTQ